MNAQAMTPTALKRAQPRFMPSAPKTTQTRIPRWVASVLVLSFGVVGVEAFLEYLFLAVKLPFGPVANSLIHAACLVAFIIPLLAWTIYRHNAERWLEHQWRELNASEPTNKDQPHRRVRVIMHLSVGVLALLLGAELAVNFVSLNSVKSEAEVMNLAGRQRMLSRELLRLAESEPTDRAEINRIAERFETESDQLGLLVEPLIADPESKTAARYQASNDARRDLLTSLEPYRSADEQLRPEAHEQIQTEAAEFLKAMEGAVSALQSHYENNIDRAIQEEVALAGVMLVCAIIISLAVVNPVVNMVRRQHDIAVVRSEEIQKLNDDLESQTAIANSLAAKAEAASMAKSEFLANMSHEIRTPMTAILGFADLLKQDDQSAKQRSEHVETIRRNGEHLLSVINDILDVSKIEVGKMTVEHISTPLEAVVNDTLSLMRVKAIEKNLSLEASFLTEVPEHIESDPVRLRQILVNLVGNAIKFTDQGGVTISIAHTPESNTIDFSVKDTGIGIPKNRIEMLFEAFTQAETSTTREFGGSGLGLRISKQLAHKLGGDLAATSSPGEGSEFVLTVPTGQTDAPLVSISSENAQHNPEEQPTLPQTRAERPLADLNILLAEDGIDNQKLIAHHLRKAGANVTIVDNGKLAVMAFCENDTVSGPLKPEQPFDLLVTDIQMPEMDGYTAARTLRNLGSNVPIVALTAYAMAGDDAKCIDAGCDTYATKPINTKQFFSACHTAIVKRRTGSTSSRAA